MKRALLLFLLCISIAGTGCKKQAEEATYDSSGGVGQPIRNAAQVETQYKEMIAKDPNNYDAIVGLGNFYFDERQPQKAIEWYQKALAINPNDANVMTDMGTMYRETGNFDKALEEFRKAASIDPRHENSRYNIGVVLYYDKKDAKGAAEAWEELLKINPNHPNAEGIRQIISQQQSQAGLPSSGPVK